MLPCHGFHLLWTVLVHPRLTVDDDGQEVIAFNCVTLEVGQ